MMNENENLVTEESVAENVEQTTEQTPRTYTEAEFNAKLDEVLGKKIARHDAKIRKEYDRKYGGLEEVLRVGTGKQSVEEITKALEDFFYVKKGLSAPKKAEYSDKDIEILAKAEADEIIRAGDDDVEEEVDRLAEIGAANMTAKEKAMFKVLAEHRKNTEMSRELSKLGVTEDVYESEDFKKFQSKFNSNTPISDIYDIFTKTQPKKQIQTMGSMKNTTTDHGKVKEYYSFEEASKFTKSDFDKNPALLRAVENSMSKWK